MSDLINSTVQEMGQKAMEQSAQSEMPTQALDSSQQSSVDQFNSKLNGAGDAQNANGVQSSNQIDQSTSSTQFNDANAGQINQLGSSEGGAAHKPTLGDSILKSLEKTHNDFNTQKTNLQNRVDSIVNNHENLSQSDLFALQRDTMVYGLTAETLSKVANSISSGVQQLTKG